MSDQPQETTQKRLEQTGNWFRLALENARAAAALADQDGLERSALYSAQLSTEAAVKALARLVKVPHEEIRGESHQFLRLYAKASERIIQETGTAPDLNRLMRARRLGTEPYNILFETQRLLHLAASRKDKEYDDSSEQFFTQVLTAPKELIGDLLGILEKQYAAIDAPFINSPIVAAFTGYYQIAIPESKRNFAATVSDQLVRQGIERQKTMNRRLTKAELLLLRKLAPQFVENSLGAGGEESFIAEIAENDGQIFIERDQILKIPYWFKATLGLLIIGTLLWPHGTYLRYVAHPTAPADFEAAAKEYEFKRRKVKQRKLGYEHYFQDVGVVFHAKALATHVHDIARWFAEYTGIEAAD